MRKENAIHLLHMGVFTQTFSETTYKTVISGCLWKGDEGLGMRKTSFHSHNLDPVGSSHNQHVLLFQEKTSHSKTTMFWKENHPFSQKGKLISGHPLQIQSSKGLIKGLSYRPLARVCRVLTHIPSSPLTHPPRSGSGGLLGELRTSKPAGLNWDLRSLQSKAP